MTKNEIPSSHQYGNQVSIYDVAKSTLQFPASSWNINLSYKYLLYHLSSLSEYVYDLFIVIYEYT